MSHLRKSCFAVIVMVWFVCIIENGGESLDLATVSELDMSVMELISSKGYPVEEYEVTTADGYILTLLRIPPTKQKRTENKCEQTPVLLMHGAVMDSGCWVLNNPNQSLGFILSDKGYDVWLGNIRGSPMSKRHRNLTSDSPQFWDFSFDEVAMYDLPAIIDEVLKRTGEDQLIYIGMSQGTTVAFALLSESPEYNKKIKLFIAMAPVAILNHMTNVIRNFLPFADRIKSMSDLLGINDITQMFSVAQFFNYMSCVSKNDIHCKKLPLKIFDLDEQHLNQMVKSNLDDGRQNYLPKLLLTLSEFSIRAYHPSRYPIYEKYFKRPTSVKIIRHLSQLVESKYFQKYDYGSSKNIQVYNKTTPPVYNVTRITTPVVLVWAEKDTLSDQRDVKVLESQLQNVVWSYRVPRKSFTHCDYLISLDAKSILYDILISKMCKLSL